jgi:hypothetical protein
MSRTIGLAVNRVSMLCLRASHGLLVQLSKRSIISGFIEINNAQCMRGLSYQQFAS